MNSKSLIASLLMVIAGISAVLLLFGCATTEVSSSNGLIAQAAFTEQFVAECKVRAEAGDINAQAQYGRALLNGWGIETNYLAAAEWLGKAAEAGNAIGQNGLGVCYESGRGVPKDEAKAVELYRKAAEQGLAMAQSNLGRCYESGTGIEKNEHIAVEWYRKAAEQGFAPAQFNLGVCYEFGRGIPKDEVQAAKWYHKAAEQGLVLAQCNLGGCYLNGIGVKKNDNNAAAWFRKAAEHGDARAQCNLGVCYLQGTGVEKDAREAVEWLCKAAEQGNARARCNLGACYEGGIGVEKDEKKAAKWYHMAAAQGETTALRWCRKAALRDGLTATENRQSSWTTKETEAFWASVASTATVVVTAPRLDKADGQKGEGILEAFGTQYMPNAYDNYEKVRAKAIEREQTLKENFPKGAESDTTSAGLYNKIAKATAMAISEYFRRRDELCHFYLMHKLGLITAAELAKLDESKLCIMLPSTGKTSIMWKTPDAPKSEELEFARKYKPETFAAYERLKSVFDEGRQQYASLLSEAILLDAVRHGQILAPLALRLREVAEKIQGITKMLAEEKLLHEVEEINAEQLTASDEKFGINIRAFEGKLPVHDYAKNWLAKNWTAKEWREIAALEAPVFVMQSAMVSIPGKDYAVCKYEVTQALWAVIMGENPSQIKGADLPVVNVSRYECQKFLMKLNELPEVKSSGRIYRLPTAEEWMFACRAGATGDYCRLADGTEITRERLDAVAWYCENSDWKPHPVGKKKPNAFGLYDMHGNVSEWTSSNNNGDPRFPVRCGGNFGNNPDCLKTSFIDSFTYGDHGHDALGFRLVSQRSK